MSSSSCQLVACPYNELNKHTKVLSINTIEHFVYIYLPPEITRNLVLYQVDKISPESFEIHDISSYFFRENVCWLKVKSVALNKDSGQHVYKLSFIHTHTKEITTLFFSYVAQNDNPDKPYIYMDGKYNTTE